MSDVDPMEAVAHCRSQIYDYFHGNDACQKYFFHDAHEEEYAAYYTSMYLLQDSTETLLQHRQRGFSSSPLDVYLEFWGVMQAIIIQQDSIAEIYTVLVQQDLSPKDKDLKSWLQVRELRNICAGHTARRDRPKSAPLTRTFMGRAFGGYDEIEYEQWQRGIGITFLAWR